LGLSDRTIYLYTRVKPIKWGYQDIFDTIWVHTTTIGQTNSRKYTKIYQGQSVLQESLNTAI